MFLLGANKIFLGANVSGKGANFFMFGVFANGGNFIFSGGNFINIRVNQGKIVEKFWGQLGADVLVVFQNVFLIGGIFFKVGGKKKFWDQENQLFWEFYGPLSLKRKL